MASRITRLLLQHQHRRLLSTAAEASSRRLPRAPLGGAIPKHDVAKAEVLNELSFGKISSLIFKKLKVVHDQVKPFKSSHNSTSKTQIRPSASYSTQASDKNPKEGRNDLTTVEDPFDAPTYNIPEKPVTFAEGASYSLVIVAGLGIAAVAGYAVFKELIFEPKEYKIFGKALARVQSDSQVTAKIGYPVTGYGNESRNRRARQQIANKVWTDEDGVEHVEVNFYIRGPHGAGRVYSEMFKDNSDRSWKFTYLIVEIVSPHHAQLMLESYVPA
uniref:Mitochondrial import inner membrane translocase subunit Tim21 n=1 Tax=Leersia perrieri TaxID=77586 RepID=A0A0D9VRZ7_9ORYZ